MTPPNFYLVAATLNGLIAIYHLVSGKGTLSMGHLVITVSLLILYKNTKNPN